jgi:hypothetical protein
MRGLGREGHIVNINGKGAAEPGASTPDEARCSKHEYSTTGDAGVTTLRQELAKLSTERLMRDLALLDGAPRLLRHMTSLRCKLILDLLGERGQEIIMVTYRDRWIGRAA